MKRLSRGIISFLIIPFTISCAASGITILNDGTRQYSDKKDSRLDDESIIEGRVYDSVTRKPVENAVVEMKNANLGMGYYRVKTGSNGYFEIDNFIPYIDYILEVAAEKYVTYKSSGRINPGEKNIYLDPEAIIKGRVTDSSGIGIRDAEVKVQRGYYHSGARPLIASTGNDGEYRFDRLPQGQYIITFQKYGYIKETVRIKYLKKGETFSLPMKMYRPASISGKVIIKDLDVPAANVTVSAEGGRWHSAMTFQDGSYRIDDLKPGDYKLHVTHQGFIKQVSPVTKIKEGANLDKIDFIVTPKRPEINIYTYRYTFAPGNNVEFNLKTFRLETVRAKIYRVPLNTFLKGNSDPEKLDPGKENFEAVTEWDEPVRNFQPYEWRYQTLSVKEPLPTGGYCIEVTGAGGIMSRRFFTVTSVGVIVKRSRFSVFAYVTDLVTSKPVEKADVLIFNSTPEEDKYKTSRHPYKPPRRIEDLPVEIMKKGKTDKDGIFHHKLTTDQHLSALVIGNDRSYALCSTGSPSLFKREENKYLVYTDRPVYRAGDTVFYKIIGKKRQDIFVPLAGRELYYKISNRDTGKAIKEGKVSLDGWGTANDKIEISPMSGLGEYEIRVGPSQKNLYAYGWFYVEQYRKPEFKIEITPSKDYYINGDEALFKVEAKYFFGAPLKGAIIRYRFYETRLRDTDTSYWWEEEDSVSGSYNRIKLEGEKYLDDNGIASLKIHTGNLPFDREITLEATVIDKSNVSITSRGRVTVGRGEYYIKIEPGQNFFADTDKKPVNIRTMAHNGTPVSALVSVELYRYIWKPYQRVYVHEKRPSYSKAVATDKNGRALLNLPPEFSSYGEFDITAASLDRRGNKITASRVIWIYNHLGGDAASRFKNLEIEVNTDSLKKPGMMTCLIKTKFTNAYVCLTIEGKDIYMSKVVKTKGNITPVAIPVKASYAPNFYLNAVMQQKRALFTGQKNISLPVQDTGLSISVKTDKKVYLPGEDAAIDIMTLDEKGKPLSADLSLSVVDESIYYIRHDHTPMMKDFFYSKISNWVLTAYSYPITLLAGAGKEGKVKVREKFEDTAFWKADIKTDSKGKASVKFKLPDNLTTWRVTARGHDRKGHVGENKETFPVTQDLIARLGKPRFLIEDDSLSLIGIVNSNTDRGLSEVKTELRVDGNEIMPEKAIDISLPPFGSARQLYPLNVPEGAEKISAVFKAVSDDKAADALSINIPVQKRGSACKLYGIGDMALNKRVTLKPVESAGDFTFVPESVAISVNPSPVVQMLKAADFLTGYPYGCVEQTINRFLPVIALHRLIKEKGLSRLVPDKAYKEIDNKTYSGIARLRNAQNDDGTWGWFAGDRGNAFLTGYVLYSLHLLKDFGYSINKNTIASGIRAAERMLGDSNIADPDAESFLLYVYSLYGEWHREAYHKLSDLESYNAYNLSYLIKAIAASSSIEKIGNEYRQKLDNDKTRYLSLLKQVQKSDALGIYWPASGVQQWGWPGGKAEITAHVLSALIVSGDESTLPSQIVSSLSKRSAGTAWMTTKQTATVILAMCGYLKKYGPPAGGKAKIEFDVHGAGKINFEYDTEKIKSAEELAKKIAWPRSSAEKEIIVTASGSAGSDVSFNVTVNGTLYFNPGGFLSIFKSEERGLSALCNGIQAYRSFSGIKRIKDINHNEYMVPAALDEDSPIDTGDEILVKIRFSAQDNFEYLVLEDYLPSGFEVIKHNAYHEAYTPCVRTERWDNRMVFFFNKLDKNRVYEIAYIIRAELPGKFMVRPTRIECMYEPSIQGWSAPASIEVENK